jgi:hypothetical protein
MPSKKKPEVKEDEVFVPDQVKLIVTGEHIASPHSIELRKNGGEHVIEARMQDHNHRWVMGGTAVEDVLRSEGLPFPSATEDVELVFSPHNGEIVSANLVPNGNEASATPDEEAAGDE